MKFTSKLMSIRYINLLYVYILQENLILISGKSPQLRIQYRLDVNMKAGYCYLNLKHFISTGNISLPNRITTH